MRFHVTVLLCAATLLSPIDAVGGDPPQWKFVAGQTLRYHRDYATELREVEGVLSYVQKTTKSDLDIVWVVDAVESDGTAHIRQVLEYYVVETKEHGCADTNGASITAGADFTFTMLPDGRVSNFELGDKGIEKLQAAPESAKKRFEFFSMSSRMPILQLPTDQNYLQKSWTMSLPGQSKHPSRATYELVEQQNRDGHQIDVMKFHGVLDFPDDEFKDGLVTTQPGDLDCSGTLDFDVTSGRLVKYKRNSRSDTPGTKPGGKFRIKQSFATEWKLKSAS